MTKGSVPPSGDLQARTISDFGDQWLRFQENEGYYASIDVLRDICGPLLDCRQLRDLRVGEIGSGSGRIVNMLLEAGASQIVAVEPSRAFEVLKRNTSAGADRIQYLQIPGDELPEDLNLDVIVSIGVLHHIPHPEPVVKAAWRALKPGGTILIWLYGKEGNRAYLRFALPLRRLTSRMPDSWVTRLSSALNLLLDVYIPLCRYFPLPLRKYMNGYLGKCSRHARLIIIYDQLNPAYAKYYTRQEGIDLLENAGFQSVKAFHRHGYSWTFTGKKPPVDRSGMRKNGGSS